MSNLKKKSFLYSPLFQAIYFSLFIATTLSSFSSNEPFFWNLFGILLSSFMGGICWYNLHTILNSISSDLKKR